MTPNSTFPSHSLAFAKNRRDPYSGTPPNKRGHDPQKGGQGKSPSLQGIYPYRGLNKGERDREGEREGR